MEEQIIVEVYLNCYCNSALQFSLIYDVNYIYLSITKYDIINSKKNY